MKTKTTDELSAIMHILNEAKTYELTVEVVHSALKIIKNNNNLSILDAMWLGRNEWIK